MVVRAGSRRRTVKERTSTLMRTELGGRLPADPRADRFAGRSIFRPFGRPHVSRRGKPGPASRRSVIASPSSIA
jgi:hypothetical protein